MIKSERELLEQISQKLDRIIALMAIQGVDESEKLRRLNAMGLDHQTIGSVTGLRPNTIAVRLFRMRKAGRPRVRR